MNKLKSLVYREFRIARKNFLLSLAFIIVFSFFIWTALFTINSMSETESADVNLPFIFKSIAIPLLILTAVSLYVDDVFKRDIEAGWHRYSYTLSITPLERTLALFISKGIRLAICSTLVLVDLFVMCCVFGQSFSVNYIVWYFLIISAAIIFLLPDKFFVLRSRNVEEMKKMKIQAGITAFAGGVAAVVLILVTGVIDLKSIMDEDSPAKVPEFTALSLLWAVPMFIGSIALSFAISYKSLSSSYSATAANKNKKADDQNVVIPVRSDGTTGLLYKELKQNRPLLIFTAVIPFFTIIMTIIMSSIMVFSEDGSADEMWNMASGAPMRMLTYVLGAYAVCAIMTSTFNNDDRKLWSFFICSAPNGIKQYMYRKYVIVFAMNLIYMTGNILAESLFATVYYGVTGKEMTTSFSSLYLICVFVLMFINSIDLPLTVRFGAKKASIIQTIGLLLIMSAFVMILEENEKIMGAIVSVFDGTASDTLMLICVLLNYTALAMFLLSYKVSCKIFMKGANDYDK